MHVYVEQQGGLADVLHNGAVVLQHTYDGKDVSRRAEIKRTARKEDSREG